MDISFHGWIRISIRYKEVQVLIYSDHLLLVLAVHGDEINPDAILQLDAVGITDFECNDFDVK